VVVPSTRGRAEVRYTLVEKEKIVAFAYSTPLNVKEAGRQYGVDPSNIRNWAKTIQAARNARSPSTFKKSRSRLSLNRGKSAKHHGSDQPLFEYLQNLREQHLKVTVRLMCAEYKRLNMEDSAVPNLIIRRRIYRWMRRKKVTLRHVTHKAHRTRNTIWIS
jgi:transposase-like protein